MNREGSVDRCPFSQAALPPPADGYGESDCPRCHAQLWHLCLKAGPMFYVRRAGETIYDLMASLAVSRPRFVAEELESCFRDANESDVIELLRELEESGVLPNHVERI